MTPHTAVEHESTLLASILAGGSPQDAEHVSYVSFYTNRAADVWSTMVELDKRGTEITVEAIASHQGVQADQAYLEYLSTVEVDPSKVGDYATRVAEGAARRVLVDTGHAIYAAAEANSEFSEVYEEALATLESLPKHFAYRDNPPVLNPNDPLAGAFSATWLMEQEFPPTEYAVPGIITEGLSIIVSPPKVGKSWWVLDAAIACSTGGHAMNVIKVDQRPVLYLALEDGKRRLQQRLRSLGVVEVSEDLTFHTDIPAGAFLTIGAFLERNADRKPLIILDTLGKSREVFTGNDAYQKDYKELGDFKSLVDRFPGSALLIVHHTNKSIHGDFVASVSGTQGIAGAADSVLTIERERGTNEAVLNVTSRDAAEGSYAMSFHDGAWHLDGDDLAEAAHAVGTRKATSGVGDPMTLLIEEVARHPEGIKSADLATQLHWDAAKVRTYLARAHEGNRIAKIRRGVYAPVASVASVISDSGHHHDATQITDVTQLFPNETHE